MKNWRANLFFLLLIIGALVIIWRLYFLQVLNHGFYKALTQGQRNSSFLERGERGIIFARDKEENIFTFATNQKVPYVFVSPAEVQDKENTIQKLTEILALDRANVSPAIDRKDSLFEIVKKNITKEEIYKIQKENLKGVYIGWENTRLYPQGTSASHVIGFVNQDGTGQYGIEKYYEEQLRSREGLSRNPTNPASYFFSMFEDTLGHGENIELTIDYHIQSAAESQLQSARDRLGFEEGTIIVIDPNSGKILALANIPSFDPNEYNKVKNYELFQNPAVEKLFEPGSVLKPITIASAIDAKVLTPETTFEDKGVVQIGGYKIYNYDNRIWGKRNMSEVLQFSINTGAVFAEELLGHERFIQYLEKFGIFEKTGIDLPGEVFSQNRELKQGYAINFATASFGQGVELTPLQLIRAFSAIANGGKLVRPYITENNQTQEFKTVISPESARTVTSMLISVVKEGYAKSAKIPGYYVAGKTGTAQIPWSALGIKKSGYSDKTIQSFVGYAPAYNPRFLILVKLQNPKTKTAEYSAVPIFHDLAKYIIDYLEIPPDYEVE